VGVFKNLKEKQTMKQIDYNKTVIGLHRPFFGKNFLTPNKIGYYLSDNGRYMAELSSGRGFSGETVYGCTVGDAKTGESLHDLSTVLDSKEDFETYLDNLN